MAEMSPNLSIIIINVKRLNLPVKTQRQPTKFKTKQTFAVYKKQSKDKNKKVRIITQERTRYTKPV